MVFDSIFWSFDGLLLWLFFLFPFLPIFSHFIFCSVGSCREGSAGVATASAPRFRQDASAGAAIGGGAVAAAVAVVGTAVAAAVAVAGTAVAAAVSVAGAAVAAAVAIAGTAVAAAVAVAGTAVAAAVAAVASSVESTSVSNGVVIGENGDGGNGGVTGKGVASALASDISTASLKACWAS